MVTIENFLAWKATFDLEMTEMRKKKQKEDEQGIKGKLTGERELQGRVALPVSTVIPNCLVRLFRRLRVTGDGEEGKEKLM